MWSDPEFCRWVDAIFDHPASEPEWYFGDGFEVFWESHERPPEETVDRLTALFSDPAPLMERYSREQLAQGFWFIAGESSPAALCHTLLDATVPLPARIRCVEAIHALFRDLFGTACSGPSKEHSEPLHMVCYMWWDIFPTWGGQQTRDAGIDPACLRVMEQTLRIPVEACQIAALHGLNHWYLHHLNEVERMIDQFLASGLAVSKAVGEYAALARRGGAQ